MARPDPPPRDSVRPEPLPWRSTIAALLVAVAGWGAWRMLASRPETAEALLGSGLHPALTRGLGRVMGIAPFPVVELLLLLLIGWIVVILARGLRTRRGAAGAGLGLLRAGALFVAGFYLLWGWQYARPGLDERLGLPSSGELSSEEIAEIAGALVERTNELYREMHGASDAGAPTPAPARRELRGVLHADLDDAWAAVTARWLLPPAMARSHAAPVPLLSTPIIRWFGMVGMYVPWTGEALMMGDLAGASFPMVIGHESAHQRGIAKESDANAAAYLVSLEARDVRFRYAGALFLQRQALSNLARSDPEAALRLIEMRDDGVRRDIEAIQARARAIEGPVRRTADRVNDAMLRGHGIPEGVASYAGSFWIIVALSRREGAEPVLLPPVGTFRSEGS